MTDGKRKLGCGTEAVKQIHLDTVGRENIGYDFGKFAAVVTHIVAYNHLDFRLVDKCLLEIVGQTLCGCTHSVDVHTVCTGTHDAAQTSRAKFKVFVKRLYEFGLVCSVEHTAHLGACGFVISIGQPCFSLGCHLLYKLLVVHISVNLKVLDCYF